MNNYINKKMEILANVIEGKKVVIVDTNNEYSKLAETLGVEVITINSNHGNINLFEIIANNDTIDGFDNRKEIITTFKEIYTLHLKFATDNKGQNLNFEDIKTMCKSANFIITDDELINIIRECEENLK